MSAREGITPAASAVLVVDLANDFVFPGGVIADVGGPDYQARAKGIIGPLGRLLAAARAAGMTVVYATDSHREDDAELRKFPPHAMRGTWNAEIVGELAPQRGDVVLEKTTYSPFVHTDIDRILQSKGIGRIYVTGLHTDCCARHTSGDAFQRGYDLVWVTDALQAFTEEAHRSGLDYYRAWYATDPERQFRTTDQLVGEWAAAPRGGA